jgi:phage terminase small subunit
MGWFMKKSGGLSVRQKAFVEEYLVDLNATQAAIRAGYSARSADSRASKLLANQTIKSAVDHAMRRRAQRTGVTQDRVVAELARLAFANMQDYLIHEEGGLAAVDPARLSRDQAAALQEITIERFADGSDRRVRIKLADKKGNLELLGRHLGIFTERVKIEGFDLADAITEARKRSKSSELQEQSAETIRR